MEKGLDHKSIQTLSEVKSDDSHTNVTQHQRLDVGVWPTIQKRPLAFWWSVWAIMVMVGSSYTNGAGGAVLGIPQFREDFGKPFENNFVLPARWQSAMYGIGGGAAFFGAIGTGWLADRFGRKMAFAVAFAVKLASITLQTVAVSLEVFFIGMLLAGWGWGSFCTVCTTYISEISPVRLRGVLTAAAPIAMTLGSLIVAIVVNQTGKQDSRWAYRTTFVVGYGVVGLSIFLLPFAPESPWWLMDRQRENDAVLALHKLSYGDDEAGEECRIIRRTISRSVAEAAISSFLQCFRGVNSRRTIIAVMPLTIHALSGVSFVASYSTYYQQLGGFSTSASFHLSIVQQIISMFGIICSWFLIDRVGRRDLTFWGMVLLTTLLIITGGLAVADTPGTIKGTVALLLVYCYFFNLTIGATAYSIATEAPTARLRIKTASVAFALENALFTMWGFVLPYLFNPDKANLGARVAFIFGGLSLMCTIYVWLYQPEFAGRSYEELDELFRKRVPTRKFKSTIIETKSKV